MLGGVTYALLSGWLTIPLNLPPVLFGYALSGFAIVIPLILWRWPRPQGWWSKWYISIFLTLVLSVAMALMIRSFTYQPFHIPSGSMVPSLVDGDYVSANKSIYGYSRYSFPYELIPLRGRTSGGLPARGDVVIFNVNGYSQVKRIIGLPGEVIKMIDGVPQINGVPVAQVDAGTYRSSVLQIEAAQQRETLPNGRSYLILSLQTDAMGDNTEEFLVPPDSYFVLGDHRDNSLDSRFTLGFVPLGNIIGRADSIFGNDNRLPFRDRSDLNSNR